MYMLRMGGTNEFVSNIDPTDACCIPPGSVDTVVGWNNRKALHFDTLCDAKIAQVQVMDIEGCSTTIETV